MVNRNYNLDINKLLLIGALMTLIGDFIDLMISYQVYCNRSTKQNIQDNIERGRL